MTATQLIYHVSLQFTPFGKIYESIYAKNTKVTFKYDIIEPLETWVEKTRESQKFQVEILIFLLNMKSILLNIISNLPVYPGLLIILCYF